MIKVDSITFKYPNASDPIFLDYNESFNRGEIALISGRNGSGKTTLTKLLTGILRPLMGKITIDGDNASKMDLFDIGQRVGYVFQNPNRQLFCDTVYNEIAYGLLNQRINAEAIEHTVEHYLAIFGLSELRNAYPGKLSHGEKQRLALAAVLSLGTDYLVLDEPTTGLDIRRRKELFEILIKLRRSKNIGIVLVSHAADFISAAIDRELVIA